MKLKLTFIEIVRNKNGNNLFQYLCTITGTLGIINVSMHNAWPTPSLPQLLGNSSLIPVSNSEGSWISVLMYLGCPLGGVLAFLTVNTLGRKKVILFTALPSIAAWIALAYARVVEIIYVARLLAGIAEGAIYTAMPMYLCEIADPKIRGLLGSSSSVSSMTGLFLLSALTIFFDIRTTTLISVSIPVLFIVTFAWMPESPYFLIMSNQREAARNNLMLLTGRSDIDNDMCRLSTAVQCRSLKSSILDLFRVKSNRMALLTVIGFRTSQQFTGFAAITLYAQILFENINSNLPSNVMTLIYFLIQFVFIIISSVLADKVGRKPLAITSIIGCGLFLIILGTYYLIDEKTDLFYLNAIPITSIMLFVVFYSIGMSTILNIIVGELFPTTVKAFALCTSEIYFAIIASIVSKFFQIVKDEFALFIPFYVFAGFSVLGLIFIIRYVPETKGKTLEEIQNVISGKRESINT